MTALLSGRRFVGPAERWLLSTVRDAQLAQDDWDSCRPALLRLGKKFDVVKMPARFVHAAVASATPVDVCAALSRTLCGPVICDPRIWYYALVPLGTAVTWTCRHGAARGAGTWCAVPRTDYTAPKGRRPYWAVPADTPFRLCDPEAVAVLLQTGHERLEATEQKKLAHRALLDHLETCSACTVETSLRAIADDCETALASHQSAASQAALTDRGRPAATPPDAAGVGGQGSRGRGVRGWRACGRSSAGCRATARRRAAGGSHRGLGPVACPRPGDPHPGRRSSLAP